MAKFDMGAAWEDSVALLKSHTTLTGTIAAVFLFLPALAVAWFGPAPIEPPPGATLEQAQAAAARIRERLRDANIAHAAAPEGRVTASIGIAAMQAGLPVPLGTLLTQADAALYRAKSAGRDRAEV